MFIAPFDKNDVFAFFVDDVADQVPLVTLMLDHHFVARNIRAVDTDVENIVPSSTTIHLETVLTTDQGMFKTFASSLDLNKEKKIALVLFQKKKLKLMVLLHSVEKYFMQSRSKISVKSTL